MRLQSNKLVATEVSTRLIVHDVVVLAQGERDAGLIPAGATCEDIHIETEGFAVAFECGRCHHAWTETVAEVQKG